MVIVMMGVSGSGKTTLARALARTEDWDFQEGDELHPRTNIDKMRAGIALDDADRKPWLERITAWIVDELHRGRHGVVTCSALKRSYREQLRRAGEAIFFVDIRVAPRVLEQRLRQRDHFMPASLLDSQLRTLEPPCNEPDILLVNGESAESDALKQITNWLALRR